MALWKVVKMQASCSGTASIQLGQMDHRIMMAVLGALLLLLTAHAGWLMRHIVANPLTKFVSSVSFQFYIWHQTLAVWFLKLRIIPSEYETPNYSGDHPWQVAFTALCFLGALAISAMYTLFESLTERSQEGRHILNALLLDPSDPFSYTNNRNRI
jgi:peptidoglycan/LPS O-acetylase OafA/YrhL